ncbi:uncharacterized protein LOC111293385 [Durio zibethinus]|uniref:Uncharacterized protein LOC111293385 n=1 Tax=Durio zibethinus TaxID=66656 RepID=A0A6P5YNH8_DURZI|nr:uncharacterized protein LOC111293385 [Durio zibethinus]
MDELREAAESYYNSVPQEMKKQADRFFNRMKPNRYNKVRREDFMARMREIDQLRMRNEEFFNRVNKDRSGKLSFWDAMTVFYIIRSGMPFCAGCGKLITSMYFTCVKCFDRDGCTFDVCVRCFKDRQYQHRHTEFLDNFVLLKCKRTAALSNPASTSRPRPVNPPVSTHNAIVPANPRRGNVRYFSSFAELLIEILYKKFICFDCFYIFLEIFTIV